MFLEIMAMKGHCENDVTSVNKKWSKLKKSCKGKARKYSALCARGQRIRAWPKRKSQTWPTPVDVTSGSQSRAPSGAMAPRNTTQYLMDVVYTERLEVAMETRDFIPEGSTSSEEAADSSSRFDYDRSLDFQHRDFEDVFGNEL